MSVALDADGTTLAVGAIGEDTPSNNINDTSTSFAHENSGAVYVYSFDGSMWSDPVFLKASNIGEGDNFGFSISLSDDGQSLAVGALGEDSATTGINSEANELSQESGAVYLFKKTHDTWIAPSYIKAPNTDDNDAFGTAVALSGNGESLAIGAPMENSGASGVNGNQVDDCGATPAANCEPKSGAVYVY